MSLAIIALDHDDVLAVRVLETKHWSRWKLPVLLFVPFAEYICSSPLIYLMP